MKETVSASYIIAILQVWRNLYENFKRLPVLLVDKRRTIIRRRHRYGDKVSQLAFYLEPPSLQLFSFIFEVRCFDKYIIQFTAKTPHTPFYLFDNINYTGLIVPILDWLRFQYDRIERFLHRLYLSNYLSNDRIATTRMATINQQQQQHRVTHRNRQRSRTHSMPDLVPLLLSSPCTTTTMSGVGPSNNELQEQSTTTTLEPAFEQDSMYPLGWLVYHPIVGVITKTEADALEQQVCCKEQEATKDNSYDEDLAIDTIKRTSSLKVETKEIESDSTSS